MKPHHVVWLLLIDVAVQAVALDLVARSPAAYQHKRQLPPRDKAHGRH